MLFGGLHSAAAINGRRQLLEKSSLRQGGSTGNKMPPCRQNSLEAPVGLLPGEAEIPPALDDAVNDVDDGWTESERQAMEDPISKVGADLAKDAILFATSENPGSPPSPYAKTMRRCITELLDKYSITFTGMVNRLKINQATGYATFQNIAREVFADRQKNWGRVVALYAFSARLAKYCVENDMEWYSQEIADYLSRFIAVNLREWIAENGGWNGMMKQFPDKDNLEKKIWRGLFVTAVGLGALATIVAAR